jgi:alkylation response protein AidB-like acyl-CoA dehydrogenase
VDLTPSEEQQAIIDLAERIIADHTVTERLRAAEREGRSTDTELWTALAAADLLGLCLPAAAGGGGYGLTEGSLIAEVVGRHVAPVPFVEALATARLLAAAGDPLAGEVASGAVVVPALREGPDASETAHPATTASRAEGGWTLSGEKRLVTGLVSAVALVVPADAGGELGLFVVPADAVGEHVESTTTAGQHARTVALTDTAARRLDVADAQELLATLRHELRVLRCAHLAGIAAGALHLAAEHCKQREQFGAPIGTFQAVAHRMADAWLDTNLIQATARQAAWRSDHDLPAVQAAASAALWACEGAQRVVHAAQHVHGGIGVDIDYPVHRYFRWAKDIELQLGGGSACARDLGAAIAAEPLTIG